MESQAQNRSALETVDPSRIFRYREGVYTAYLLAAAIVEFDFFTWLDKNPASLAEICSGLGIAERPTDVMLTLFQSNGFITQEGDRFTLTDTARTFLTSESPYSLLTYYTAPFATQKQLRSSFMYCVQMSLIPVRTGMNSWKMMPLRNLP